MFNLRNLSLTIRGGLELINPQEWSKAGFTNMQEKFPKLQHMDLIFEDFCILNMTTGNELLKLGLMAVRDLSDLQSLHIGADLSLNKHVFSDDVQSLLQVYRVRETRFKIG